MPERDMPNISEPEQPDHKLGITWDGGDELRVQALMAENERLREALDRIAAMSGPTPGYGRLLPKVHRVAVEALGA